MEDINKIWAKIDNLEEKQSKALKTIFIFLTWILFYSLISTFTLLILIFNLTKTEITFSYYFKIWTILLITPTLIVFFLYNTKEGDAK